MRLLMGVLQVSLIDTAACRLMHIALGSKWTGSFKGVTISTALPCTSEPENLMAEFIIKFFTRKYEAEDWQTVCQIHDLARPIELEGSCDPRAFIPLADDVHDLEQFRESQKLVACCESRVVGFVCTNGNEIGWLYVDPLETRKGIGRYLVRQALEQIGTAASVFVLDGNLRAKNLYLSEGFKIVDEFNSKNNGYPCKVLKMSQ